MYTLTANQLGCFRQTTLFRDISFQLKEKQALLIQGRNGSGKSTLLRMLAGIATPPSGSIHWQQQPIHTQRANYVNQMHFISHANGIKLALTVAENIQLQLHLANQHNVSFNNTLDLLHLDSKQHVLANTLSAGQKRRLALAKLWLIEKPLWILDEPFTALDRETQHLLTHKITEHLENQGLVILTSHQPVALPTHVTIKTMELSA